MMEQESLKRAASTSPVSDTDREAKRQRFASDIWSEEEHLRQDEIVRQSLLKPNGTPMKIILDQEETLAVVLQSVCYAILRGPQPDLFHAPSSSSLQSYMGAIANDPELMTSIVNCYTSGSYKDVRCLKLFRKEPFLTKPASHILPTYGQAKAIEQSWQRQFSGDAARALWKHIKTFHNRKDKQVYAHYTAIVQSSGMGKSRTVDELAKDHFVIPLNLRGPNSSGYPPADSEARDFLAADGGQAFVYHRACAFLWALFEHTAATLRTEFCDIDNADLASQFRTRMTEGQTFQAPNAFEQNSTMIANTKFSAMKESEDDLKDTTGKQSVPTYTSPNAKDKKYDFAPARACEELVALLSDNRLSSPTLRKSGRGQTAASKTKEGPLIVLAFDEAHTLTERKGAQFPQWSNFSELRHALRALHRFSCFSLFMSTTGKISQFTSAREDDYSLRIICGELVLIQPFTDVGFDTLAYKIKLGCDCNLEQLTTNDHMAHLGRPLFGSLYDAGDKSVQEDIVTFAAVKLLNTDPRTAKEFSDEQTLACLCQRLPIEFNSTTYISQAEERKQVEGHMRVCLKIDAALESMVTTSASEPLLSEAAYSVMAKPSFDVPKAMKSILDGFSIDQGDRGELLTMLLFTIARDNAVGPPNGFGTPAVSRVFDVAPFLSKKLFKDPPELQALLTDFPEGKMHFNHYIKVHEFAVISAKRLLSLCSRGAGVLCADGQTAIDGINPFLYKGENLEIGNLGLILWQSKNNPAFTSSVQPRLFTAMDVYKLGILKQGDAAIPLVKIVFALAGVAPSLNVVRHAPSAEYNAVIYEIWCAGISPNILDVVEPGHESVWAALLHASYGWKRIYQGHHVDKDLRRSMNPGAAKEIGHWNRWLDEDDD